MPLHKINNFISVFIDALKSLFYIRLWTPFFLFAVLSTALAYIILHPYNSIWTGLVIPIGTSGLFSGGPAFLHYPTHILLAPAVYTKVNLIFAVLLETLLLAGAVIVFNGFYNRQKICFGEGFSRAAKKYLPLVITSIIIYVVFYILGRYLPPMFTQSMRGSPLRLAAFLCVFYTFMFAVLSPFIYVMPFLVLKNENLVTAFKKSFKTCFKNFFTTFFMIFITQGIVLPLSIILDLGVYVTDKFGPEIIIWILYLQILVYMIASFLLVAMLTRIFEEYHE